MSGCSHPIFARVYARLSPVADVKLKIEKHRRELLDGIAGRVIEIGAGNGLNFAHYPALVTEVVAVEPEPYLRAKAAENAARAPVPVVVRAGRAERVDEPDASFDAAVFSLTLCSIADPDAALREAFRLLRPGGEVRFYEHVRSSAPGHARFQDLVDPLWSRTGGGCHPNRDTVVTIERAGFIVEHLRRFDLDPNPLNYPVRPHVIGRALRP